MVSAFDVKFRNSFPIAIFSSSFCSFIFYILTFHLSRINFVAWGKRIQFSFTPNGQQILSTPSFRSNATFIQFSSVSQSCLTLATPWTAACQASPSITNSLTLLKLMSIESVMPSNHFILCRPLLVLASVFPCIRVFSNESALCIRWPKYWGFSFSSSPCSEYSGLISLRMDWLDLLAV